MIRATPATLYPDLQKKKKNTDKLRWVYFIQNPETLQKLKCYKHCFMKTDLAK